MKLRYSATSPYVRKVGVVAIETGLQGRINRVPTVTADPANGLAKDNPLGKVPVLITDDGVALYDSPVICEYLDSLHEGRKLVPPSGAGRWIALRRQALADGILDAAVLRRLETHRPSAQQSAEWIEKQRGVILRSLDALEAEAADLAEPPTIGEIAIAVALGYIDFRFADDRWRGRHPGIAGWYETFAKRPSMTATVPKDPA